MLIFIIIFPMPHNYYSLTLHPLRRPFLSSLSYTTFQRSHFFFYLTSEEAPCPIQLFNDHFFLFYLQVKKALAWRVKEYWILDDWTPILPNERAQRPPLSQKLQVFHQHMSSYQWFSPCRPYKFPNANKKKLTAYSN